MSICDYGCGNEALYKMTSGKLCCSSHYSKCPENRRKNSEANSGEKNHMYGKKRPEFSKMISGKNHPMYGKRGVLSPFYGRKRPDIAGDKHFTKRVEVRDKISKSMTGKKKTESHKRNLMGPRPSISMEKHPNWRGGKSFEEYCSVFSDKEWRIYIYERDGYSCRRCGITKNLSLKIFAQNLSIHHIDYNKKNCDPSNCITVCNGCNTKANHNRKYWEVFYPLITISRDNNISYNGVKI